MCKMDYFNQIKRKETWKRYSKKGQKEEDESEEDWKLQLEAEDYEGEGPQSP